MSNMNPNGSIFDRVASQLGFGQKQQPQTPPTQQGNQQSARPGNQQQPQNPNPNPQNGQPANQQPGGNPNDLTQGQSLEEQMAGIWNNPSNNSQQSEENMFAFDQSKFGEMVNGMDFMKGIDSELSKKALAGDQASLQQLINSAGRNQFSVMFPSMMRIMEGAFAKHAEKFQTQMQEQIRSTSAAAQLRKSNPAFANPKFKPLVDMLSANIRSKNPSWTPEQVAEAAQTQFSELGSAFAPQSNSGSEQSRHETEGANPRFVGADGAFDWAAYATDGRAA